MSNQHNTRTAFCTFCACALWAGLSAGCALVPPRSFLDPTAVGMFPLDYREGGIRRVLTPRDGPLGLASAVEPTAEDLVVDYSEYRIGQQDVLTVNIDDFQRIGMTFQVALEVSPSGYIRLPQLGAIRVLGMTEHELEQELRTRLQEAGILTDPIVQVFVTNRRSKVFNVVGSVTRPGTYPLAQPDTRLLDVLGMVGDVGPLTKRLYVVRRTGPGPAAELAPQAEPPPRESELVIPPPGQQPEPFEGALLTRFGEAPTGPWSQEPQTQPTRRELNEVIAPRGQIAEPATQPAPEQPGRRFAPLIFDPTTGTLKEAPEEAVAQPEPAPPVQEPFVWEEVPEYELSQRVIEVDVEALKAGDPRYNIVVRDRDLINVPVDTAVFYMMGEVARPGVYSFGGREITIKQALATAGGFAPLAWPSRCEIIRREAGTLNQVTIPVNLDRIFAGLADDVLLRDGDIVNVGTDIVAPFLFVIRNSFRFTYGFGFVYDRNFADEDAVSAKINPDTLRRQERAQRGLPF